MDRGKTRGWKVAFTLPLLNDVFSCRLCGAVMHINNVHIDSKAKQRDTELWPFCAELHKTLFLNFGVFSFWRKKNDQVCSFFVMLFLCTEPFSFRARSCFCETSCSWILLCGVYPGNFILISKKTLFFCFVLKFDYAH